ncbi:MAG: hypothetical protein DRH12_04415 [Deltaproteobacteria bacterium]|nr:MAG: hypothetical protein DRH12_04415 [Deltaproteobacteria bacterium]
MIRSFSPIYRKSLSDIELINSRSNKGFPINFKNGERFKGTILKAGKWGLVTVSAKGGIFTAHAKGQLSEGSVYEFMVTRVRPNIELRIVPRQKGQEPSIIRLWVGGESAREQLGEMLTEIFESVESSISQFKDGSGIFAKSSTLLAELVYGEGAVGDPRWLRKSLSSSGLFWENKVARLVMEQRQASGQQAVGDDLKGLLLRALEILHSDGKYTKETAAMEQKVSKVLHLIESHQGINFHCMNEGIGWFWFLPIRERHGFGWAKILARKFSRKGFSVWIDIKLSQLGRLQVFFRLAESELRLTFFLEDEHRRKFASRKAGTLLKAMEGQGLFVDSIDFQLAKGDELTAELFGARQKVGFDLEV